MHGGLRVYLDAKQGLAGRVSPCGMTKVAIPQTAYARDHQSATGSSVDSGRVHCDQACSVMCQQLSGVRGLGSRVQGLGSFCCKL